MCLFVFFGIGEWLALHGNSLVKPGQALALAARGRADCQLREGGRGLAAWLQEGGGGLLLPLAEEEVGPAAIANQWFRADVFNEDAESEEESGEAPAGGRQRSQPASRGAPRPGPSDDADSEEEEEEEDGRSLQAREEGPAAEHVTVEAMRGVQAASLSAPGPSTGAEADAMPAAGEVALMSRPPAQSATEKAFRATFFIFKC